MIARTNNTNLTNGLLSHIKGKLVFKHTGNVYADSVDDIFGPDVAHDACIGSFDNPPTWFEISFGDRYIIPTYYSMRGRISTINGYYLRSWVFEGKTKKGEWIKLHEQENNQFSYGSVKSFPIETTKLIKAFRISMTGTDSSGKWWICLSHIEVYGMLVNKGYNMCTNRQRRYYINNHIFFFIAII